MKKTLFIISILSLSIFSVDNHLHINPGIKIGWNKGFILGFECSILKSSKDFNIAGIVLGIQKNYKKKKIQKYIEMELGTPYAGFCIGGQHDKDEGAAIRFRLWGGALAYYSLCIAPLNRDAVESALVLKLPVYDIPNFAPVP